MIRFLSAAGATALFAVSAQASFINVDFGSTNGTPTGPAVIGSPGDPWTTFNAAGFSGDSLQDTVGGTPTVGFFMEGGVDGGGGGGGFGYTGIEMNPLMEDYLFINNGGANPGVNGDATLIDGSTANYERRFTLFTNGGNGVVEDLDPNQLYNLYLYASGDQPGQGSQFMLKQDDGVGGFTYSILGTSGVVWNGTFVEGGNYVVFENVSPTAHGNGYEFELSWFNGAGGEDAAGFNGIQLEIVPEPGSLACLAVGTLIMLRRRRAYVLLGITV